MRAEDEGDAHELSAQRWPLTDLELGLAVNVAMLESSKVS